MSWAVSLPISAAAGLGPLRFLPGAEACRDSELIWLRGTELSEADELRLRQLAGAQRFSVNERNEIVPSGSLLPVSSLPSNGWQPLRKFLEPALPELRIVSGSIARLPLTLVRDTEQREVAALLTSMSAWRDYALTAPQVRLAPIKFAVSNAGNVLIIGQPLLPLQGERFWEQAGLFAAAGWHWSPAVDALTVRQALQLLTGDFALWHANGEWELIRSSDLVPARRSAVRATAEGVGP